MSTAPSRWLDRRPFQACRQLFTPGYSRTLSTAAVAIFRRLVTIFPSYKDRQTMPTYAGSCHCGTIAFEVDGVIDSGLACNCSICTRKGSLLWFVPRQNLRLKTPLSAASTYTFNKHVIKHRFCPKCGIHPFGEGTDPKGNAIAAINLRCIGNLDLSAVPVHQFDGKAL